MDTSIPEFPSFAYFINILSLPNSNSLFRQLTVLFTRNLFSPTFLFQRKRNGKFRSLPLIGGRSDLTDHAYTLDIYGGKIHIDAETGDGIDSNGTLTISGGTVEVFSTSAGDNSPLDSDGALTVTGGTVLAVGNSGTAQTPESGLQNYIVFGAAQGFGMQQPVGAPKNAEDAGKAFGNENGNARGGAPSGQRQPPSNESGSGNFSFRAMRPPMQADGTAPEGDENRPDNFALPSGTGANLSIAAGDILTVTNEENTVLYRATAVRSANYVLYSSADLDENETYTLNINGTASGTATVSDSAQSAPSGIPGFGGNATPPDGTGNGQNPPAPPSGGMPGAGMPGGNAPGGGAGAPTSYTAANTYSESTTLSGKTFSSTGTDENAVLVTGGDVVLRGSAVTRNSSDSTGGDSASFYGVGAANLVTDGNFYIKDSTVSTDAKGGAGVFAYGNGTAYVADTEITTKQDTSGGIHAAGGGMLYAWDLDVTTDGESSAEIRSDRGGGKMVIDGGSYVSNGKGSPAVYSTADIAVNNATLTANGSEAVCIEGLNSLSLYNSTLSGNMSVDAQNDTIRTVIVYQSMSGDSEIGCGKFSMKDGKLISNNGDIFYTTNTESEFYIENTEITATEDAEFFLRVTGNQNKRGWGTVGANGADCLFTAADQEMNGDIVWDKISTLKLYIANGSTLTGAVLCDAAYDGNGSAALYIDESSSRVVTGNSTLTALYCAGSLLDKNGKTVSVVSPDGSVLKEGDSEYTVTAKEYADTADMSKMGTYTEWSEYETEKPSFFEASSGSGSSGSSSAGSSSGSSSSGSSSAGTAEKPTADDKKNEDFFDDVSRDDWFYDAVKFAWENGFMKGTSERTFSPEAPLSRAMLITVLYRPEGQPSIKALDPTPFTDIDTNDYCFDAVAWAKGNVILYGVTDTTFAPNQNVTREQLAAVLYRYAKYKGAADSDSETEVGSERESFSDADEISDYAAEAVGYCRRAGLLKGKDNNLFAPNEYTVRAQIAAVLQRIAK